MTTTCQMLHCEWLIGIIRQKQVIRGNVYGVWIDYESPTMGQYTNFLSQIKLFWKNLKNVHLKGKKQ